jgi:hypothetical protein
MSLGSVLSLLGGSEDFPPPPLPRSPSSLGGPAPVPLITITPANQSRYAADGRDLLEAELRAAGLWRAFTKGELSVPRRRKILERLILAGRAEMRNLVGLLVRGATGLGRWFSSSLSNVVSRFFAATFGLAGAAELPDALYPVLRDQSNFHAAHLARFRDEIKTGDQLLDGTAASRSSLYADASWAVAHNVERAGKRLGGEFTFEQRVLGVADHCDDCVGLAALDWQPIGTLPAIGGVECMSRCHCTFIYA